MMHREKGFTLLEVVVALTVAALALGGTMSIASSSAANTTHLERTIEAHWVAGNAVAMVRLTEPSARQPVTSFSETMLGRRFDAETRLERVDDQLMALHVVVSNDGDVLVRRTEIVYGE